MMMEQPPASLSSPAVSAVNTAAKLQITPEGGLRLVTDKDVLGKDGSVNGQAQQQPQQKFFATRTQDGRWNLLMAPSSDPSRLFLVQPTGGQRFQLAPSRPGCVTLRPEVTSAHRTFSSSNSANGSASSKNDAGRPSSDDKSVAAHHEAVVVPVPQLRPASASLSTIVPPKTSAGSSSATRAVAVRRTTPAHKLALSTKPYVISPVHQEHLGNAHLAGSKAAAVRDAVSGRDSLKSISGRKGSRGGTRLTPNRSKIVLVEPATLNKASGKAGGGGEVATSAVQSVTDCTLSAPGKSSLSSASKMADSSPVVSATTTACSTTATITSVTTTTTTVTTTTSTTVTNSSTTDTAALPGLRTRPPADCCDSWRASSLVPSTTELPFRKKTAETSNSRKSTNARLNNDSPGKDTDVKKTDESLSVNSTKDCSEQCFDKIVSGKKPPNQETAEGGKSCENEPASADRVLSVVDTKLRKEICDENVDKAGKESSNSQENSSKFREQLGSNGAVKCAESMNEPDAAAIHGSGDACEHDGRSASEQTSFLEDKGEETRQKGKTRKQKKIQHKADESVRRKLRARVRDFDKTSELTKELVAARVSASENQTLAESAKNAAMDKLIDISERPAKVNYTAEKKSTPHTPDTGMQSENGTLPDKGAKSARQTPSDKGVQSKNETLSHKGLQSENDTSSDKGVQSENDTLSDKGAQSEKETSNNGGQSENETSSDKGVQSESQTPADKEMQSESQTPSDNGVQSEDEALSDNGAQSESQTPSDKEMQSESQPPSDKEMQSESQTPSDNGAQSENETPSEKEVQSENEELSDHGAQSENETPSDKEVQSENEALSDRGAQSENETPSDKEVQSENEALSDRGAQSENEALSGKEVQSENEALSDNGAQSENETPSDKEVQSENEALSGNGAQSETSSDKAEQSENGASDKGMQSNMNVKVTKTKTLANKGKKKSVKKTQSKTETSSGKRLQSNTEALSDEEIRSKADTSTKRGRKTKNKTQSEKVAQSKYETASEKAMQSKTETPSEKRTQSENEAGPENETSEKRMQSEKQRSSDMKMLSNTKMPKMLSEKEIPEVLEKAEMCATAFVVLERLSNRDIAFLCRKFRNARVRSRCSALCRVQTLHELCSIGAISCGERLLTSVVRRKTSSKEEKVLTPAITVSDSSSTETYSEDELDEASPKRKKRKKRKTAKDLNTKKGKHEKLSDLNSARSTASSVVGSSEPVMIRVSLPDQAGSSLITSNQLYQTSLAKSATTRYSITPASCRPLMPTPFSSVQTVPAVSRHAVLLPRPAPVGAPVPNHAGTVGPSVSLKQATRKSLSEAISNSLARKATSLSGTSDLASPSVPVTLSPSLSPPRLILAACTSPGAVRCLKEAVHPSGVGSPASATAMPSVRKPAAPRLTKPPSTTTSIPTTTTTTTTTSSSTASLQSSKVIVSAGNTVNKQFYLVQIGDKRLLVPVTTPTTTITATSSSSLSTSAPVAVSTSASVPVCLSSVVTSPTRSTVLLANKSSAVVTPSASATFRPFTPAPTILQSKNPTASAPKLTNRAWSGPRTVAGGDSRVILLPVNNVPPLVSGAGTTTCSSSMVRRVNILGTSSFASLRPLTSTSLLKAVTRSSLVQQHIRLPAPKRGSTMTEAERLAKRARLEKKYPLPPGVVIKTEPETRGYGDEGVNATATTTAATISASTTSSNTCIIRIATNPSSAPGVRPGMAAQGIRVGGPIIIRGGTVSSPIFTLVPAATAAVTSGTVVSSAATVVPDGAAAALVSAAGSGVESSVLGNSAAASLATVLAVTQTTVTEQTQSEPVASLTTETSTSSSSSSLALSTSASSVTLPPPPSSSQSSDSTSQLLASDAVDATSQGQATPDASVTCPRQSSDTNPPATAASPSGEPDAEAPLGVLSRSASATASSSAPSPCPAAVASPSPLASLGAMWVRQAADSPDSLPRHVDARSLKGERVRRLRETLAKQLQNLGDERKQRALQALERQLCVDD